MVFTYASILCLKTMQQLVDSPIPPGCALWCHMVIFAGCMHAGPLVNRLTAEAMLYIVSFLQLEDFTITPGCAHVSMHLVIIARCMCRSLGEPPDGGGDAPHCVHPAAGRFNKPALPAGR